MNTRSSPLLDSNLIKLILSFTDKATLYRSSLVCHFWHDAANYQALWKDILCRELRISAKKDFSLKTHPKQIVKNLDLLMKNFKQFNPFYRNIISFFNKNRNHYLLIACLDNNDEGISLSINENKNFINGWLDFACALGASHIAKKLFSHPLARRADIVSLKYAAAAGNQDLVEYLLEKNPELKEDEQFKFILLYAERSKNEKLIAFVKDNFSISFKR